MSQAISNQYLTFHLGQEVFAVDIAQVKEVLEYTTITKVPQMPPYILGIINLRGHVVPVVDMRMKFSMAATERTVDTCIIILEIPRTEGTVVVGAMADSVKEVLHLEPGQIEPPPRIGTSLRTDFIRGMGKHDDRFIILLETAKVFSEGELEQINASQQLGAA